MQRNPQLRSRDLRQKPQCRAQEAFHIAYATPVGARTLNPQRERIGIPGLPLDRDHIGVTGNHDAALSRTIGGGHGNPQVRAGLIRVIGALPGVPVAREFRLDKLDNAQI